MRKIMLCLCLLCIGTIARGQTSYEYVYWLDNDMTSGRMSATSGNSWQTSLDVVYLSDGLHSLHIQVRNTDSMDVWSAPVTRYFIKQTSRSEEMTYRYWFDNDNTTMVVSNEELSWLDVSALDDGLHMLHVMAESTVATQTLSYQFLKVPQVIGVDYLHCLCYLDGKLYRQERVSSEGGIVNWELDVNDLKLGLHNIQVQVVTPSGAATGLYESMFLRTTTDAEMASLKCFYTIDGVESYIEAGTYADGAFHFDLDVSALDDGLHQLAYMLVGDNGVSTKVSSAFFMKTPLGGNGITQYWYWLNDDDSNKTVVRLEERTSPYQLIGLLPVESVPIRSSCFHFEVDEEKGPMLYAKNEFHIRFFDATDRLVDATKSYLDYNVSEKVTGMEEIKKTQTFGRPAENGIKWFTLQACEGDTIAFRSSQALSLQVFSPSGKEIYTASGAESVKWDGCHTWEEGTHYVAVHDVTGSQPNVTLDYLHMDKYDVVDQDLRVVGNGGYSTITFYGNGFSDLYAIDLVSASGDTIDAKAIHHESDATVNVTFDFTDKPIGMYDAVFHFTTEDKKFTDILTVEEAKDITLDIDVRYPSTFLRGTSVTYSIEIVNNGNNTAYSVPLEIQVITGSGIRNAISDIKLKGEVPVIDLSWVDDAVENPDSARCFKEYIRSRGDMQHFVPFVDSISDQQVWDAFWVINIPPNSIYKLDVSVLSTSRLDLMVLVPTIWEAVDSNSEYMVRSRSSNFKDGACCYREKVECFMNIVVAALDFVSLINPGLGIADCAANVGNEVLQFAYDVWCGESNGKTPAEAARDLRATCVNTMLGCIAAKLGGDIANLQGVYQHIYNNISVLMDCGRALTQQIPNCPPNPGGGGGSSSPVNSWDPNEIYGYISPSGSKFIAKDSVETVNYRIEFENDTAFATSSAHVVEICDTLDARFFELSTFAPTYFNIGDKREQLDGTPNFVRTVDMRPQINTVVQVEGQYDEQTGIARWLFTSLDPMTMEPTDDVMQGFLPVNHDGTSGIGDVGYRIGLKKGLADGVEITNRASIVFDSNEPILTPAWTNIVDGVCPESRVTDVAYKNDSVVTLSIEGSDERSGIWKYDLYVQYGVGAPWIKEAELAADSTEVDFRIYDGLYYGFCTLATDSAGNVEQKLLQPEALCAEIHLGDVNSDGVVNERDAQLTMDYYLEKPVAILAAAADVNEDGVVNTLDVTLIVQMYMNAENAKESAPIIKQYYTIRR